MLDDDHINNFIFEKTFEKSSIPLQLKTFEEQNDLYGFLQHLDNNEITLSYLFLDLNLKNITGIEVAEVLLKNYPNLKIIILTSNIDPQSAQAKNKLPNIIDFAEKPITLEKLYRFIGL